MYAPCIKFIPHSASAMSDIDFVSARGKKISDQSSIATPAHRMIRRRPTRSDQIANVGIETANTAADASNNASVVVNGRPSSRLAYETKYTITMYPLALIAT